MDSEKNVSEKPPPFLFSMRFILTLFIFLQLTMLYTQRSNLGIAIVCMVNNTALKPSSESFNSRVSSEIQNEKAQSDETQYCPNDLNSQNSTLQKRDDGPLLWTKKEQGLVLSAFFYGYIITQIPGGWFSVKFGGNLTLSIAILLGSILTLLLPTASRAGFIWAFICRFLIGFFHGPCFPSLGTIWANWAAPHERSRMVSISFSGMHIGTIVMFTFGAWLCVEGFDEGWGSIFYIFGIMGAVTSILFYFLMAESPKNQKMMSKREAYFLQEATKQNQTQNQKKNVNTPWISLFTSKICLAIYITLFSYTWGGYLFLTQLPTYMRDVLKFDIKKNGLVSSIPYIAIVILNIFSGFMSDYLSQNNILAKLTVRRLFTAIGLLGPAISIFILSFLDCRHPYIAITVFTTGYSLSAFCTCGGFFLNQYEIGGPFSGIIIGISNTIGTIPGFLAPYIVNVITKNRKQEEWQIVFWITSSIYVFGCVVYLIFADITLQPWAIQKEENNSMKLNTIKQSEAHLLDDDQMKMSF